MFEQKLADAKAKRWRQFIRLTAILLVISLLVVIVFVLFYCCRAAPPEAITRAMSEQQIVEPELQPIVNDELRLHYLQSLTEYENIIKPQLEKVDVVQWDKVRHDRLLILEDQAIENFGVSDYAGALTYIEETKQLAQVLIDDSAAQFNLAFADAQTAYSANDYDMAKMYIDKALMLDSSAVPANALYAKIAQLPEILLLKEKIDIAKIENDYQKEIDLLAQLLKLDPQRSESVQRQQTLHKAIKEANFASYVQQFYQSIKQGELATAQQRLQQAKNIFPTHQDMLRLTQVLQEMQQKHRLDNYQQTAQTAMADDDWLVAKQQLELLLGQLTADQWTQDMLVKSNTIIALHRQLDEYIANPYRLVDQQISAQARDKSSIAKTLLDDSPSLHEKIESIDELLEKTSKKKEIEIISDNQTHILVRGVGVIGMINKKVIKLAPGNYVFEGKKKGFKSKLINLLLAYDKNNYRLEIICDEPI